ncbi:MAG TPA: rod shape-determining protein [Chloroflexota bacterium]|nr:rod shape-determining protein [Chloroflexota bacterium]
MLNPIGAILGLFSHDVGIDLGTANTLVLVRGRGIVVDEPSVVAIHRKTKKILAIGAQAKLMVGRTPMNVAAIRPLADGVISDFDAAEQMLKYFITKVHHQVGSIPRPRVVLGVPGGITEVEKMAVYDAARNAGAREAHLIEEPMAAAIGAGLPVTEPIGSMIVDVGGGTTEVAVISLGGVVVSRSIRVAGDELDQDIVAYARQKHGLLIGDWLAEEAKISAGSACPLPDERVVTLRGRDVVTGLPRSIEVSSVEIREAMAGSVGQIVDAVRGALEDTPPELIADVADQGIVLAGGGSLLCGLDRRLSQETRLQVCRASNPRTCVVRGTGEALEELNVLETVKLSTGRRR